MLAAIIMNVTPKAIRTIRRLSLDAVSAGLGLQQLRVLTLIKEGIGPSKLAQTLDVSLPAVSKLTAAMESKKLIRALPGKDGRTKVYVLTNKGQKTLLFVSKEVESHLENRINNLSSLEKNQLKKGLIILDKIISEINEV